VTVSGVDSVRVRVHLYERRFRRNPDTRIPAGEVRAGLSHDTGGARRDVTHGARFCRTTATCIWGVSDRLFQSAEPRQEGGRGGRSRPRCSVHCCRQPRWLRHGRHRAPPAARREVVQAQGHGRVDVSPNQVDAVARLTASMMPERGNTAPASVFPPFSSLERRDDCNQGTGRDVGGSALDCATRDSASP
jgi:hypothetical protein